MGFVRAYRPGDECDLAPRLREADLREIELFGAGRDPMELLREGAEQSVPSCTIIGNIGFVAGMFGVVPEDDGFGKVWLVGSDELVTPPLSRQFLRECRKFLAAMEPHYLALGNHIDARNTLHIKWLQWMGFTFIRREPQYLEFIKLCAKWQP